MPWWCSQCGERRYGFVCKCGCEQAEQIPPWDKIIIFDSDPDWTDEDAQRERDEWAKFREEREERKRVDRDRKNHNN